MRQRKIAALVGAPMVAALALSLGIMPVANALESHAPVNAANGKEVVTDVPGQHPVATSAEATDTAEIAVPEDYADAGSKDAQVLAPTASQVKSGNMPKPAAKKETAPQPAAKQDTKETRAQKPAPSAPAATAPGPGKEAKNPAPETAAPAEPAQPEEPEKVVSGVRADVTSEVAVVGITWEGAGNVGVQMRTRTGDNWTTWESVADENGVAQAAAETVAGADGPDQGGQNFGTEPIPVVGVSEVEVAVEGQIAKVENIKVTVVDPGTSAADDAAQAPTAGKGGSTAVRTVARPTIYSRASWGADPKLMKWTPQYGKIKGSVIHHTESSSNYSMDQVPGILRGIYYYHSVSRGWGDIGYNVLVDKYGRAWEGRYGGLDRHPVGAHAKGANTDTFGISVIGSYTSAVPPAAALGMVEKVIAWKLGSNGVNPRGTMTVTGNLSKKPVTVRTVVGHRDVAYTDCPGNAFYAKLPSVRENVARIVEGTPTTSAPPPPASAPVTWAAPRQVGQGWTGYTVLSAGDWNGDGVGDLLGRDTRGDLWLYPGRSDGAVGARTRIGWGWNGNDKLIGGTDWNGDGKNDLIARRKADGALILYAGNGRGGFLRTTTIGASWGAFSQLFIVPKAVGSKPVIMAVVGRTGQLLAYPANGAGGFGKAVPMGTGWNAMNGMVGVSDWNGDGKGDLLAADSKGLLWAYRGNGAGGLGARTQVGNGWNSMPKRMLIKDGTKQLWTVDSGGRLWRYEVLRISF